jgi:hypothetical protein
MSFYRKITSFLRPSSDAVSSKNAKGSLRWQKLQEDLGKFVYEGDGFTYPFNKQISKLRWADIERLVVYKLDLFATDEICLNIFSDGRKITWSESTPGWYQFIAKLQLIFPAIPDNWDGKIVKPPFAANYTVLYEREDRIMPAGNNFFASFRSVTPLAIEKVFQDQGWTSRKAGWTELELVNIWSELHAEEDGQGALLNGQVAFHPGNIEILNDLLDKLGPYQYEFYDAEKNLLLERRHP